MPVECYMPSEILKPYVESFWIMEQEGEFGGIPMATIPDGRGQIIIYFGNTSDKMFATEEDYRLNLFNEQSGYLQGNITHARPFVSSGHMQGVWASFKPWGMYYVFGIPLHELTDREIRLDAVFGRFGRDVIERVVNAENNFERVKMLESFLIDCLSRSKVNRCIAEEGILFILENRGILQARDVSKYLCQTERTTQRQFRNIVGTGPKDYANSIRLIHACHMILQNNGVFDTICEMGYYDQSHFIRHVRKNLQLSVKDLFSAPHNHLVFFDRMFARDICCDL